MQITRELINQAPAPSEYEADVQAILTLWEGYTASWQGGLEAGAEYIAAHNYHSLPFTAGECLAYYRDQLGWQDGYAEGIVVDAGTITRDDDWVLPASLPGGGAHPEGRVYTMEVEATTRNGAEVVESYSGPVHSVVIGSTAQFFMVCS